MQPCSREMQAMNSLMNTTQQIPLRDLHESNGHQQIQNPQFDSTSSHDDFLEQMLPTLPSFSWSDLKSPWDPPKSDEPNPDTNINVGFHYDEILASKLRQHQINGEGGEGGSAAMKMMMQQQMMLAGRAVGGLTMPLGNGTASGPHNIVDEPSFKSPNHQGGEGGGVQALFNGFGGRSVHGTNHQSTNQTPHFQGGNMQAQNFGATAAGTPTNQSQASGSTTTGGTPAQPKQRVRARRGQATDPHSIAERVRKFLFNWGS